MKTRWLLFLALVLIAPSVYATTEFTDAEAKRYFEGVWNSGCLKMPVGRVFVSEKLSELPEGFRPEVHRSISKTGSRYLDALASRGILKIEALSADPMEAWAEIEVAVTRKGESLKRNWKVPQEEGWFCVKWGTSRLRNIGRNEIVQRGLDVYRVVMLTSETKWTPEYVLWEEVNGRNISENRKSIVLLKHDPFLSRWDLIAHDTANLVDEFTTDNVARELNRR